MAPVQKESMNLPTGFYTGFSPRGGKWHYYHSVCSMPIIGGSGGMLLQENF